MGRDGLWALSQLGAKAHQRGPLSLWQFTLGWCLGDPHLQGVENVSGAWLQDLDPAMSWGSPATLWAGVAAGVQYRESRGDATQVTLCRRHLSCVNPAVGRGRAHRAGQGMSGGLTGWEMGTPEPAWPQGVLGTGKALG